MRVRIPVLLVLSFAFSGLLSGCNLFGSPGTNLPLTKLTGEADGRLANPLSIGSSDPGNASYWADPDFRVPLDWTTTIFVPGHTVLSIVYVRSAGLRIDLATPLVPANNEVVVFDTSRVFYGTDSGGGDASNNAHKYQFATPSVPVVYH